MLININRCSVCYSCQVACKDEFVGNVHPPYSYSQTDKEQSWITVTETEKGTYPYVKVYPTAVTCMQCENAPCMKACSVPGCMYRTENGVIIIDPDKCNGCQACLKACPYGAIVFNDDKNISQKCTLCQHRIQEGKEPACVDACPSGVFTFGEESKILQEAKNRGARVMHPEYATGPKIYYIGLPSPSLVGHLIDSVSLMDIAGADVTLTDVKAGSALSVKSNVSGNILVQELKLGNIYNAKVTCKGYQPQTIDNIVLDVEYKHLGNMKLKKL